MVQTIPKWVGYFCFNHHYPIKWHFCLGIPQLQRDAEPMLTRWRCPPKAGIVVGWRGWFNRHFSLGTNSLKWLIIIVYSVLQAMQVVSDLLLPDTLNILPLGILFQIVLLDLLSCCGLMLWQTMCLVFSQSEKCILQILMDREHRST